MFNVARRTLHGPRCKTHKCYMRCACAAAAIAIGATTFVGVDSANAAIPKGCSGPDDTYLPYKNVKSGKYMPCARFYKNGSSTTPTPAPVTTGSGDGGKAVAAAMSKVGKANYVYGGKGPNNFDCSGFVSWAWKQAGKNIPSSTAGLLSLKAVSGPLQPGDLLISKSGGSPTGRHVNMVVDSKNMVGAQNSKTDVKVIPIKRGEIKAVRP